MKIDKKYRGRLNSAYPSVTRTMVICLLVFFFSVAIIWSMFRSGVRVPVESEITISLVASVGIVGIVEFINQYFRRWKLRKNVVSVGFDVAYSIDGVDSLDKPHLEHFLRWMAEQPISRLVARAVHPYAPNAHSYMLEPITFVTVSAKARPGSSWREHGLPRIGRGPRRCAIAYDKDFSRLKVSILHDISHIVLTSSDSRYTVDKQHEIIKVSGISALLPEYKSA